LIRKRAEIAGQIEYTQAQLRKLVTESDYVEATLSIFKPDIDLAALGARKVPTAHHAFRGEMSRIILEALRKTTMPMDTMTLNLRVMKDRGLDTRDVALARTMSKRVGATLRHWESARGVLKSLPGPGQRKLWILA
jgi:hypothetical protein